VESFPYVGGGHAYSVFDKQADVQWTEPCMEWIKKGKWKK
jgi:hypothetical protein